MTFRGWALYPIRPTRQTLPANSPSPPLISMPKSLQQGAADLGVVRPLRDPDRVQHGESLRLRDEHGEPHGFQPGDESPVIQHMPREAGLQTLLETMRSASRRP